MSQPQEIRRLSLKWWPGSRQVWVSIILLLLTLGIAVRSIEQAQWITPQPSLTFVLILAVLIGLLLSKSRLPNVAAYFLALVLGGIVTLWQASSLLSTSETALEGINQLIIALSTTKPSESAIHFAASLIGLTWIIGYVSTWFILRKQNAWVAVSLGIITILVNLSNLTEHHHGFFFFYLLAAMLLIAHTNLTRQYYWFKKRGVSYPKRGVIYFLTAVICLNLLMVSVAWSTPYVQVNQLETLISTSIWRKNVENFWTDFLVAVPSKLPSLRSSEQTELLFGEPFDLSNRVLFVITSKRPAYWRTWTYDIYTSRGWKSSPSIVQDLGHEVTRTEGKRFSNQGRLTYGVVTNLKTDILLIPGEVISIDTPAQLHTLAPLSFDIDLTNPVSVISLPPDVVSLTYSLLRTVDSQNDLPALSDIKRLLPEGLRLVSIGEDRRPPTEANYKLASDSGQLTSIELTRVPQAVDVTAVTTPRFLKPNQRYVVTAGVTSATSADLSKAGEDYPPHILDHYSHSPYTLPWAVSQLSITITKEAKSPYGKIMAIKHYLSQIPYNENARTEVPPPGVDGVEYFLFTRQSGNCVDFASAMVLMLRNVGIPSRLCVGYLPGEPDKANNSFIIRARHYHAWPEVYFPGYGWVPFEATPSADSEGVGLVEEMELVDEIGGDESLAATDTGNLPKWYGLTLFFSLIGFILLMFVIVATYYYWLQVFIGRDYAPRVYARMCSFASLARLSPQPQQTPFEYANRLASVFPLQAESIGNITQAYVENRFAQKKQIDMQQREKLLQSWRDIYHILLKRLFHLK